MWSALPLNDNFSKWEDSGIAVELLNINNTHLKRANIPPMIVKVAAVGAVPLHDLRTLSGLIKIHYSTTTAHKDRDVPRLNKCSQQFGIKS